MPGTAAKLDFVAPLLWSRCGCESGKDSTNWNRQAAPQKPKAMSSKTNVILGIVAVLVVAIGAVRAGEESQADARSAAVAAQRVAVAAAQALIGRVLPSHASQFVCEAIPQDGGKDVFEIEACSGKIVLRGNNAVAIASALNWYLKHYCRCDISWCGDQLNAPSPLPAVAAKVRQSTPHKCRTFFNYCTFGYSIPWWGWPEWEKAIDKLAMQGYNMPLAATGMEAIWYHTLRQFNFTDLEARSFLAAPGHLPWQLTQNLEGMNGPLPRSWIDSHADLGRKILARERELGMMPIQQGFSGYVPRLLKRKFPAAEMKPQPPWCGFPGVMQLDPLDPLFEMFGRAFLTEEMKLYGAGHRYAADPFHESEPPRPGAAYLTNVGKRVFAVMTEADPQAIWIMQGWTNHREIIEAVPRDRLLILSIPGADNGAYYGYPFLNCRFNNFGCRNNLHGDLRGLAANPFAAVANAKNSNCCGAGLMMEGIFQNPVYLQMSSDLIWRNGPVDAAAWLHDYARRRYGAESSGANQAWDLLLATAYAPGTPATEYSSIIAARPALDCKRSGPNEGFRIPYPPQRLVRAWGLLLQDRDRLKASDGYRFDVADVARQVLSNLGQAIQKEIARARRAKDGPAFARATREFLDLLADVDAVCAMRKEYHFGKWVGDARRWGTTDAEKAFYERNAATLVTLWGPDESEGSPQIFDYAWREWAGLIRSYYRRAGKSSFSIFENIRTTKKPVCRKCMGEKRFAPTTSTESSPTGKSRGRSNVTTCLTNRLGTPWRFRRDSWTNTGRLRITIARCRPFHNPSLFQDASKKSPFLEVDGNPASASVASDQRIETTQSGLNQRMSPWIGSPAGSSALGKPAPPLRGALADRPHMPRNGGLKAEEASQGPTRR